MRVARGAEMCLALEARLMRSLGLASYNVRVVRWATSRVARGRCEAGCCGSGGRSLP